MSAITVTRTPFKDFLTILPAIIIAWILIDLWRTFIINVSINCFGMKNTSVSHTLILASIGTLILLIYLWYVDKSTPIQNHISDITPIVPGVIARDD